MKKERKYQQIMGKFKSIQSALFTAVSVLVLCAVLVATVVSLRYTSTAIFENSIIYTKTIIQQLNTNIDSYITYMDNIASMVSESVDTRHYLSGDGNEEDYQKRILEQFSTILSGRPDIRNIGIVKEDEKALFNTGVQIRNPDLDISTQQWYEEAVKSKGKSVITSSHVQHIIKDERPWVITLSKGIESSPQDAQTEGVVFIDLNYNAISELCDQNSIGEKGYVFILDENGNIVYHPQQQQLYNELQTENIDLVMNIKEDTVTTGSGKDEKIYAISRSPKTGWTVVGCMNTAQLLKSSDGAKKVYLMTAVILVAIALFISSLIARNITSPIQKLRNSMAKVQEGDFSAEDLEIPSENEIGSLTQSFNVMTHRIQELMEENIHEQEQKRKSELKALQSQINPHFLYNTLDSIIWMAEGKKNEEVVLMTAALARLLRQSISNEDELVSIGQEVEYVRSYLTIQKMRYKDKLEFSIEVDPDITANQIIKLVLQPLTENAIYHGLKYKENKGLLIVRGYEKGEDVVLEIIDNGVGMDEETLAHIFEKHKVNYRSNGVGVYNVQKRLTLYYGHEYGITYRSKKGEGTIATIVIPKSQEEHHGKV